ncbi:MAG: hypothetical protein CEE38_09470 [Planctomycetes bacterium B3_Pla]|nr:MAG: hypothetical protein CEE38_09470 [Planctomycetes bacterium B3_Pla]
MKKIVITSLIVMMVAGTTFAAPEGIPDAERLYKFNIIGVENEKSMDQGSGKVIFVDLNGKSKINLVCSDDEEVLALYPDLEEGSFDILDKNATNDDGAILALPDPDLDPYIVGEKGDADVWSAYSLYIRPLGKPGGWATITTCADLLDSTFAGLLPGKLVSVLNREGDLGGFCSIEQVGKEITERPKGKSVFTNVTAELLTIVFQVTVDLDGDGIADETVCVRVPIFDDIIENEYWEYDNHGLKLLQVWIYDNETDVSEGDGELEGC